MMLEVKNVSFKSEGRPLMEGLSFTVDDGQALCLLGARQTGKSLLMRALMGLEPVDGGHISIDGELLNPTSAAEFRRHMAYIPQRPKLMVEKVAELAWMPFTLEVGKGKSFSRDRLMQEWHQLGLDEACYDMTIADLSMTDLQLVLLSVAAVVGKSIILADEPAAGFSADGEQLVADYLLRQAQKGHTVLVTSCSESFAALFERQIEIPTLVKNQ